MDATKQRWINELAKYDFSLEYQKGKNNMVADALSQERRLSDWEAEELLKDVPLLSGNETIMKTFEGRKDDSRSEAPAQHTVSLAAMKAVFDNLTLGAGRRAKLEYDINSPILDEVNSIEISVKYT